MTSCVSCNRDPPAAALNSAIASHTANESAVRAPEWGHWTYNPNIDEIEFEDDPTGGLKERYDSAIVTAISASMRIDQMAQALVSNAKNRKDQR